MIDGALPIGDWQFWGASVIAALALVAVIRPLLPSRRPSRACPKCTEESDAPAKPRRAELTIEGERPR
jgi:hypothetical protein